jgi:hypothetical protein
MTEHLPPHVIDFLLSEYNDWNMLDSQLLLLGCSEAASRCNFLCAFVVRCPDIRNRAKLRAFYHSKSRHFCNNCCLRSWRHFHVGLCVTVNGLVTL